MTWPALAFGGPKQDLIRGPLTVDNYFCNILGQEIGEGVLRSCGSRISRPGAWAIHNFGKGEDMD